MVDFGEGGKFPELQKGDTISLKTFPGLSTRSIQVDNVTYEFPEAMDVIDTGLEVAEHLRIANDPRAGDCIGAFRAVAQALTGATARLEVAVECEQKGQVDQMKAHVVIAKERLMQAISLAEQTKQYVVPQAKRIG